MGSVTLGLNKKIDLQGAVVKMVTTGLAMAVPQVPTVGHGGVGGGSGCKDNNHWQWFGRWGKQVEATVAIVMVEVIGGGNGSPYNGDKGGGSGGSDDGSKEGSCTGWSGDWKL
ncbi:hypothetical protein HKD37_08G021322 [Glycine soja]